MVRKNAFFLAVWVFFKSVHVSFQIWTFPGDRASAGRPGFHTGCSHSCNNVRGGEKTSAAPTVHHRHRVITSAAEAGKVWITRPNSRGERIISGGCRGQRVYLSCTFGCREFGQVVIRESSAPLHVGTCGEMMKTLT